MESAAPALDASIPPPAGGPASSSAPVRGGLPLAVLIPLVAAIYFVASEAAMMLVPFRADIAVVWFASAVGLAALLLWGLRAGWGVLLGAFVCALISGKSLPVSFLLSALNVAQVAFVWWLIVRFFRVDLQLNKVRDMVMLLALSALVSPLLSALRSLIAATSQDIAITPGYIALTKVSALGEAVGLLMLVPLVVTWKRCDTETLTRTRRIEALFLYLTSTLIALGVFGGLVRPMLAVESLPYALFPVLFWAAIRFGPRETATAFFLTGTLSVACTVTGHGPFSSGSISALVTLDNLVSLYMFLSVLGMSALVFSAGQRQLTASQKALRAREEQYRLLVENQTDLLVRFDSAGTVTFASPSFLQYFGVPDHEVLGRPLSLQVHEEDKPTANSAWAAVCCPPYVGTFEIRVMTPQGWRWVAWSARATTCAAGSAESVIAVGRDVTDRHRAEEQARQHLHQLAHVGRISSMGEMASAIAHEINQPLTAIANYASACLRMLRAGRISEDEALGAMQRVATEAERAGEIVRKMRGFVRGEEGQPDALDARFLIEEVVRLSGPEARQSSVALEIDVPPGLPPVLADSIQIQQVLLNLVRNAIDSINGSEHEHERRVRLSARLAGNGMVEMRVSDSGPGLAPAELEKVFEAFYTTKADGIGIGLALSRSIADAHGGRLWASSTSDGATFHLQLPLAHEFSQHEPPEQSRHPASVASAG